MNDEQYLNELGQPDSERLLHLPLWAREWINTLRFEVIYQQDQIADLRQGLSDNGLNPDHVLAAVETRRRRARRERLFV